MGLHATVYLTGKEAEILEAFCKVNGCTKSQALKYGLMQLSNPNSHGSGEHNGELRVEIPLSMRLKGFIREAINEVRQENKAREERYRPFREAEETAEKITREIFK